MPPIDPSKLLGTLKPLLDTRTGGIKSRNDADKIYHLMSKFSKKLVSKCTYLNILQASPEDVLDTFMESGGWDMIFGWLEEAVSNQHYSVVDEILSLLLRTPATVDRLRKNGLPKDVKQLTKVEIEGTKLLAEKVVAKWIAVARNPTKAVTASQGVNNTSEELQAPPPYQVVQNHIANDNSAQPGTTSQDQALTTNVVDNLSVRAPLEQQEMGVSVSDDAGMRNMPEMYDGDGNANNMDIDVDIDDIADVLDFNPDLFSKTIDQHLPELNSEAEKTLGMGFVDMNQLQNPNLVSLPNQVHLNVDQSQTEQPHTNMSVPIVTTGQQIIIQTTANGGQNTVTTSTAPAVPRILIKKVGGGKPPIAMTQQVITILNAQNMASSSQEKLQICTLNGKQYVVRVVPANPSASQPTINQQVASSAPSVDGEKAETADTTKPAILKKSPSKKSSSDVTSPKVLKTYSKKDPEVAADPSKAVSSSNKSSTEKKSGDSKRSSSSTKSSSRSDSSSSKKSSSKSSKEKEREEKEKEEALRQKTKEARKKMKERMKEKESERKKSELEKQKQKDDATLKQVFNAATSSSSAKIPKKPKPSFDELIGVPGAQDHVKLEKVSKSPSNDKDKDKSSRSSKDKESGKSSSVAGENGKEESESTSPPKERRHRAKVYVSSKSKNMDIVESMTKGTKSAPKTTDTEKAADTPEKISEKPEKPASTSFEDALLAGSNSRSSKPTKRPSIDSGKSGETKKVKLDDSSSKKEIKEEKSKEKSKEKSTAKKQMQIQESSLFMDALNASCGDSKSSTKKRRRISSEPKTESVVETPSAEAIKVTEVKQEKVTSPDKVMKPVFNFYRDTLNDDEDETPGTCADDSAGSPVFDESIAEASPDVNPPSDGDPMETEENEIKDSFAPTEEETKLKSCLCIHRPKGREKKLVRWREEEELKEFYYFEMDETERVNVFKQNSANASADFSQLKHMEQSLEKNTLRNKMNLVNEGEERLPWRTPRPLILPPNDMQLDVRSQEKDIQEQREQNILQVFYFPGSHVPECPDESGVISQELDVAHLPKKIPAEDVPVLTKVSDFRATPWPLPAGVPVNIPNLPLVPELPNPQQAAAIVAQMNLQAQVMQSHPTVDVSNPWLQASSNPQAIDPWKAVAEVPNPFQVPPPFGFPNNPVPPYGQPDYGYGNSGGGIHNADNRSSGFMDGNSGSRYDRRDRNESYDRRRNDGDMRERGRDRPPFSRDRESSAGRGNRGGPRDRDRGYDRDYRYEERGGSRRPLGRRGTLCNYFARGHCREGSKCAFLHPGVNGPALEGGGRGNFHGGPRGRGHGAGHSRFSSDDRRDNSSHHRRDEYNKGPAEADPDTPASPEPERDEIPAIQSPVPEFHDTTFDRPPSSPSEAPAEVPTTGGPVRVIPAFAEEEWG